jgi:hypothetical protein
MRRPIASALCPSAGKVIRTDRFLTRDIMGPVLRRSGSSGAARVTIKNFPGTAPNTATKQAASLRKNRSHSLSANRLKSLSTGKEPRCLVRLFRVPGILFYSPTGAVSCEDET